MFYQIITFLTSFKIEVDYIGLKHLTIHNSVQWQDNKLVLTVVN